MLDKMKTENNQTEKSLIELKGDILKKEYEIKECLEMMKSDKTKIKEKNEKLLNYMFYSFEGFFYAVFSFYGSLFICKLIGLSIWIGMTFGVCIACVTYLLVIEKLTKEE